MGLVSVKRRDFRQLENLSVDSDLGIAPLPHLVEELLVMSLSSHHYRGEQVALPPGVVFHNQVYNLLIGVPDHFFACCRRVGLGCPCIQKSQEIIDFRDCPDRGPGIVSRCFLFYRNDWAQSADGLDFRFFEYAHEMFGVRRKCVHISALALGIDGVKGQG